MTFVISAAHCPDAITELKTTLDATFAHGAKSILVLAAENTHCQPEQLIPIFSLYEAPIFGGVFPGLIHGNQLLENGFLVVGLASIIETTVILGLSAGEEHITSQLGAQSSLLINAKSLITLFDGLAPNAERLAECLYELVGVHVRSLGGGAGSLDFVQKPCLFTNNDWYQDAAIIAGTEIPITTKSGHGCEVMAGPFLVTGSNKNLLSTLNYDSAFEVYKSAIERSEGITCQTANFNEIAKQYPLGIANTDNTLLVRDPIYLSNTDMYCVGEIPQNSTVYILKCSSSQLLDASRNVTLETHQKFSRTSDIPASGMFVFDCISRRTFLEDDFSLELGEIDALNPPPAITVGALTLGEICNQQNGIISLLNKSLVIGCAP